MKTDSRRLVLATALAIACGSTSTDAQESIALERFVDRLASENLLSMSVAVLRDGDPLLVKGYGFANREDGIPNTGTTRFRIGSLTKQFTAMAILILQEEGRISVDEAVETYLPDLPEHWKSITLHQLLTHTSGIMHSWALPEFGANLAQARPIGEIIELFYDEPLLFEPGEGFVYSGVGYFLLALLIEEVSGQTYESFLRTRVFDPLGMHDTGSDRPGSSANGHARGYDVSDGIPVEIPPIHMPIFTGGGNLYSTAEDLVLWAEALTSRRLISPRSYAALYTPETGDYAYGWFVRTEDGERTIFHSGGLPGSTSFMIQYPDAGVTVITLSNLRGGMGDVTRAIAREVLEGPKDPVAPVEHVGTMASGTWRGSGSPPGGGYIELEYEVVSDGDSLAITVVTFGGLPLNEVRLEGSELRFWWSPERERLDCVLEYQDDGGYAGDCIGEFGGVASVRMHPPRR